MLVSIIIPEGSTMNLFETMVGKTPFEKNTHTRETNTTT
jgi:hypothetical protein